ncbi:CinA family protein [Novosphingobium malaysiense]|uniref:Damage-inducible protein CinA n=1 Tax=Novosphingobium malaysiense TaxID=1348853 RepID=A0A0B1ZT56_9SPHN|nr:CinA family protein [Novosphingobium malaysiense]KHK92619.1 damage-inducible protein CinA [Novosphingobium malaysiense]
MAEALDPALPRAVIDQAETLLDLAHDNGLMLVTAESCTGGMLASLLTDVPSRSHVFERGIVAYSADAKCELLAIERRMVDACGAVSREVAEAMALGALNGSRGDVALAITGFAGPGGVDDEEGLVHFACARHGFAVLHREAHFGAIGRAGVRRAALEAALQLFEEALNL